MGGNVHTLSRLNNADAGHGINGLNNFRTFWGQIVHTEQWELRDALLQARGYTDHKAYLKSDHWQSIRKKFIDPLAPCFCCGCITESPVLHHLTYRNVGQETAADLVQLCFECHDMLHAMINETGVGLARAHFALSALHIVENCFGEQIGQFVPRSLWQMAKDEVAAAGILASGEEQVQPGRKRQVKPRRRPQ